MPSPSASLASLRPDLGSLLEFDLAADRLGFIGSRVLPVLEVSVQSGAFGKIPIEQLLKERNHLARSPGSGYSRDTFTFTSASFACQEYGHEETVDDRESRMYAQYFDAEAVAAQRALDAVLRGAEKRIADLIFNSTTWTGSTLTTAVTLEWDINDATTTIPIADINAARQKVWNGCGMWPNALIINREVFNNLRTLTDIKNAIASSGAGFPTRARDITTAQLAQVFDLDYILVAGGAKNTADEGITASLSQIWSSEYAMVAKIATTNDIREPCLGRMFHWGADGSSVGGTVESYRDETIRGDVIRVRHDVDELVLYTECAHLLSNVTTI